mmetsp:Transcript_29103/g.40237  ORF Transcript_29103/g.40237 Transcript_29103/m.40237 type:complete len:227 (+) Transcript_29103:117-797(+)|eukprot:CAMPEP_0201490292 /NCGR_PEP_ID=MMETSP0151_2-20130828/26008_1 /ASSEMBLY_ACC=CAM_ASM_000257 /TAXON_ID=200890 /ORGANISM="Paramoeba atlantica, Strain 621/1 / CCAP 1560/9" /LENGTH=226 /DNA_ID=CAMNT_0047876203 /DNA_START=66 /DNA_END=746 /DNA_ORIENTATION=+
MALSVDASGPLKMKFGPKNSWPKAEGVDLKLTNSFGDKFLALVVDNVFSKEECEMIIKTTEERGFSKALVNVGGGRQVLMDDYRSSDRCMSDDKEFAEHLFERLKDFIPAVFSRKEVAGLNERMRFLRYGPGGFFAQHHDGCYVRPGGEERSYVTIQLYLNDRTNLKGGETTFFHVYKDGKAASSVPVTPKPGRVLIFQHNMLHEGSLVAEGPKYTLRTDVMYKVM